MKKVFLGIILCLIGFAIAIIAGAMICNTILGSDLYESRLANQAWIIIRVMLWSAVAILDIFFVVFRSFNLIFDDN